MPDTNPNAPQDAHFVPDDPLDKSFEAANAIPAIADDVTEEPPERAPIDLDAPVQDTPHATSAPSESQQMRDLQDALRRASDDTLRARADLQNFRRRGEEERLRIVRDGNERLIKELFPVLDDFDLAVQAAKLAQSFDQLVGGVEATARKFHETLAKQGVVPIEAVGQPFDPDLHEAVLLDEDSDLPDETVTAELRRGYTLHSRVIRPSLVKVAKRA